MSKIIFHIDVNSAFLSWTAVEELNKAELEGRTAVDLRTVPSVVAGDPDKRRGIVTAASLPAKKRGVRTADTLQQAYRLCPDLITVKSDFGLYRHMSRQLMELLRSYSSLLQQMSIDECFLDVTELVDESCAVGESRRRKACLLAHKIRENVKKSLGFTVNVGISENKVLAKMASDFEKPDKVHSLFPDEIKEKMWPLDVGELFMAGKASAARLKNLGIETIGDLAVMDPEILEGHLKSHGRLLWDYANGRADDQVSPEPGRTKTESVEETLSRDCIDLEDAFTHIDRLCKRLAGRLYNHGFRAGEIAVLIKYADFTSMSHQRQILSVTRDADEMAAEAESLFEEMWTGKPVRLLGVRAGKLVQEGEPVQMSLKDLMKVSAEDERRQKADRAMNDLKEKFGEHVISRGKRKI